MKQHQVIAIEDKDIFDYLKVFMYSESAIELKQAGKEIHRGVFYETICMLENVECGLTKIKENIIPTLSAYLDSDAGTKEEVLYFLNLLRLDKKLIDWAGKVDASFSIQVTLFIGLVKDDFPEFYHGSDWEQNNPPLDRIFECIAKYREKYKLRQKEIFDEEVDCNQLHSDFVKLFDKIVKKEKKVYVLNLAVKIIPKKIWGSQSSSQWRRDDIEHVMRALRHSYKAVVQNFNVLIDLVDTFMGANEGLNFHLVLILKNDRAYNSKQIAVEIWSLFHKYLNEPNDDYLVTVDSINERIRHQFKLRHITGVLGYRPKKQLEDFNYWFLYLFIHIGRFVRAEQQKFKNLAFDIHEVGYRVSTILDEVRRPRPRPKKTTAIVSLSALYREFKGDAIWSKAARKLNNSHEYVELCRIFDEQRHFFAFEKSTSELIAQLELFMLLLEQDHISPIGTEDAQLEHIVQEPKRNLSLIEKLAIILLQDHSLSQTNTEKLTSILKGTLSPRLAFFFHEHNKNRNVVKLSNYQEFSLAFYKDLHKYLFDLKEKINPMDIAAEKALRSANVNKNFKSVNEYVRYYFKNDVDVYRFKMTCNFQGGNVPEALLSSAFSEIWTDFLKDIKRKSKVIGKQLLAHVGTYVSQTVPLMDVTLIFDSPNIGAIEIDLVENINKHWRGFLTDKSKKQLIRKLEQRQQDGKLLKDPTTIDYMDFFKRLSLDSSHLPLINEKRRGQDKYLSCNYKDKKQRSKFIKILAGYYVYYGFLKRKPVEGCETQLNLMLKGRMPSDKQERTIPEQIQKSDVVSNTQKVENNSQLLANKMSDQTVSLGSISSPHPPKSNEPSVEASGEQSNVDSSSTKAVPSPPNN